MSCIPKFTTGLVKRITTRLALLLALAALALPATPLVGTSSGQAEAGSKSRSMGSGSGGGRKMRTYSGGVRTYHRSFGGKRHMASHGGSIRKGGLHNVKRYGGRKYGEKYGRHGKRRLGERRSGVRLGMPRNFSTNNVIGMREVAGSRSVVKKRRLVTNNHHHGRKHYGHKNRGHRYHDGHHHGRRYVARGYRASGALVVVVENGNRQGMQEIAGNGGGGMDCAYGSYCTIDLGGPKIITYNDVEDVVDGDFADEDLSDEEYEKKYGLK